jgi:hypothetical protein
VHETKNKDQLIINVHFYTATRPNTAFVQVSFVSYLLVAYMVAEFQQDRLDQMLYGFLQFPCQERHAD